MMDGKKAEGEGKREEKGKRGEEEEVAGGKGWGWGFEVSGFHYLLYLLWSRLIKSVSRRE